MIVKELVRDFFLMERKFRGIEREIEKRSLKTE